MFRNLLLSMIALFIFSERLKAQDTIDALNFIILEYGIHNLHDQDLILSPFILQDISFSNITITYKRNGNLSQRAQLSFDSFDPTYPEPYIYFNNPDLTSQETINNDFTFVRLNYGIGKLIRSTEKYSWIVGGMSENTVMAKYYYAGYFSTFGYFASFGLSAWSQFEFLINKKNAVSATVYFPVAAWVSRSPYLANDDMFIENTESHNGVKTFFAYLNDGDLQTLNKLQQFTLRGEYSYKLNNKFSIGAVYQFSLLHNSEPVNLTSIQNELNIKAAFNF